MSSGYDRRLRKPLPVIQGLKIHLKGAVSWGQIALWEKHILSCFHHSDKNSDKQSSSIGRPFSELLHLLSFRQYSVNDFSYPLLLHIHLRYFSVLSVHLCIITDLIAVSSATLNIVSVALSGFPSYQYALTAPTYDIALEDARIMYPETFRNVSVIPFYRKGKTKTCPDEGDLIYDEIDKIYGTLQSLSGPTLIQTSGCDPVAFTLGDFARELDLPLIISTAGNPALFNDSRFPTLIGFGPADHSMLAYAAMMFLQNHSWTTVTLLCARDNVRLSPFDVSTCGSLERLLMTLPRYTVHVLGFNPENITNYLSLLQQTKKQSRIVFISCAVSFLRPIMSTARSLGMTSGDYVFLSPQSIAMQGQIKRPWSQNDTDDAEILTAYRSLIIYNIKEPDWHRSFSLMERIATASAKNYKNGNVKVSDINMMNYAAYEGFMAGAEIIEEYLQKDYLKNQTFSGTVFAEMFTNRKFSFITEDVRLSSVGARNPDIIFRRFFDHTKNFEEAWLFTAFTESLEALSDLAGQWPRGIPPPNRPACGFVDDSCDVSKGQTLILSVVVPVVAAAVLIIGAGVFFVVRYINRTRRKDLACRWLLDSATFFLYDLPYAIRMGLIESLANPTGLSMNNRIPQGYGEKLMVHDKHVVFVDSIMEHPNKLLDHFVCLSDTATAVALLSHHNIGYFYGLLIGGFSVSSVWRYERNGSLRHFLDADTYPVDSVIRFSFCWDILSGLHYLRTNSTLKYHGSLSSIACMVDERLSLHIVGIGSRDFRRIVISALLTKKNDKSHDHVAPQSVFDLWLAPEHLLNPLALSTEAADMFSMAVIFAEIWTGQYPLKVPLRKPLVLQEALWNLIPTPGSSWPLRISVKRPEVPPHLHHTLYACLEADPTKRPTLKDLITLMMDRYPKENVMDSLLRRLESYAAELEIRMHDRTAELREEKAKTDEILSMLMPSSVVKLLRDHHTVQPEVYESASVLFSKIPDFQAMCGKCTGIQIIQILSILYRTLDDLISAHEVYKVEAMADSYMVASGIPHRTGFRHALEAALLAIAFIDCCNKELARSSELPLSLNLQIGLHSGSCAAGIIGHRLPRYCLFGDTVNTASRMQAYGEANKIHISQQAKELLDDYICNSFKVKERGCIQVKGKGEVTTFWLTPTYAK